MCSGICWYSWSTHWAECSGAGWEALAVTQSPAPYLANSGAEWSASQCPVIVLLRRIITPRSLLNTSVMIRRHSQFLEYSLGIPLIIKDLLNFSTATHQIGAGLMRVCVCHDVPSLCSARLCLSPVSWVSGPGCLMSPCPHVPMSHITRLLRTRVMAPLLTRPRADRVARSESCFVLRQKPRPVSLLKFPCDN